MKAVFRQNLRSGLRHLKLYGLDHDQKDLRNAERRFKASLAQDPGSIEASYFLGVVADLQGEPDRAIQQFEAVLQREPEFEAEVRFNLGVALYHKYHARDLYLAQDQFLQVISARNAKDFLRLMSKASLAQVKAQLMIRRGSEQIIDDQVQVLFEEASCLSE